VAQVFERIDTALVAWINQQHVFFVATAPGGAGGHVNCSPKGLDSLRMLDETTVAYLDVTGSGAETIAHLKDNGRIVIMFCAFEGPPRIVRLHGRGDVVAPGDPEFAALVARFPPRPGIRCVIRIAVTRISDSCGYGVPLLDFRSDREAMEKWAQKKGPDGIVAYQLEKNRRSLDGLSGVDWLTP
jgi:Pyridoxamine 5'-phosphate oxidase